MGQLESAQRGPGSWSNMQLACLRGFFQEEIALESGLSVGGTSPCIEGMNRAKSRERANSLSLSLSWGTTLSCAQTSETLALGTLDLIHQQLWVCSLQTADRMTSKPPECTESVPVTDPGIYTSIHSLLAMFIWTNPVIVNKKYVSIIKNFNLI